MSFSDWKCSIVTLAPLCYLSNLPILASHHEFGGQKKVSPFVTIPLLSTFTQMNISGSNTYTSTRIQ
jgi:hypothetical protein